MTENLNDKNKEDISILFEKALLNFQTLANVVEKEEFKNIRNNQTLSTELNELLEFYSTATRNAVYVATACGGVSEVGLYTMLGGCFRSLLEKNDTTKEFRLLIDSRVYGSEERLRPDFQIHKMNNSEKPLFVSEFKFLSNLGEFNGGYLAVFSRIENDLDRLKLWIDKPSKPLSSSVVFYLNVPMKGNDIKAERSYIIDEKFKKLGFELFGKPIVLWRPDTVTFEASLEIRLARHSAIANWPGKIKEEHPEGR